ncbi:MAG: permease-like cell division protein FtsX [bacterium]
MFFVSLYRAARFALQDFWRNIWLSLITVFIIMLTLFLVNLLLTVNVLTDQAVKLVEEKVDVSVYFTTKATEKQVLEVRSTLLELPAVREVEYLSEADALIAFKVKHQNDPTILETLKELDQNPLGATLVIKAKNPQDYPGIIEALGEESISRLIEDRDFDDYQAVIKKINAITSRVYQSGAVLSGVFILVVLLIVFNTIRIAIYTHREEIGIMRLVGANNWFIRLPFLLESVLYSLLACLLVVILIYPLLGVVQSYMGNFFQTNDFSIISYFNGHFILIFGLEFLGMALLNIVASSWATRKYLKV